MFTELVRLGRDSSVKPMQSGTSVANLACAYYVGYGEKRSTQWLELAVFGKQAEALAPYFVKGQQFMITAKDLQVETFQKNDGTVGAKLKAVAVELRFFGSVASENINQEATYNQPQTQYNGTIPPSVPQRQPIYNNQPPAYKAEDDIPF